MFVNLSDGHGLLGNKLNDELNTLPCNKPACCYFDVAQAGLKTRFRLVPANLAMP
jgi:hypothetical protein